MRSTTEEHNCRKPIRLLPPRDGQSFVELAFVLAVLTLVLLGIIELVSMFNVRTHFPMPRAARCDWYARL